MLAIDQRESLRTLLVAAGGSGSDRDLRGFKVAVARTLSPAASGILIDRDYGLASVAQPGVLAPSCGLIVAVDRLIQRRGGTLEWSELDSAAMTSELAEQGARALKFLVVWRPDDPSSRRADMVGEFIERCHSLGLLSVLEGLVQVPAGGLGSDMDAAIQAAAEEFAPYRPDLYKTHVPTHGHGSPEDITVASAKISSVLASPWVVLSAGVPVDLLPAAVEAACKGGASGFLAGRGIWGPSLLAPDVEAELSTAALARFERLVAIVDAHGRPWPDVHAA